MKIIHSFCAVVICIILFVFPADSQEIDAGTGIEIGKYNSLFNIWSPDGKVIAFEESNAITLISAVDGQILNVYTSTGISFEEQWYSRSITTRPCFSSDSNEIIITSNPNNSGADGLPILVAIDLTTKTPRLYREKASLGRFSRDGKLFCYVNYDSGPVAGTELAEHAYTLAVENLETRETRYYAVNFGAKVRELSVSADKTYVVAVVVTEENNDALYKIPLDGSESGMITTPSTPWHFSLITSLECSPVNDWVMFTGWYSNVSRLFVYNPDANTVNPVFPETTVQTSDNAWSPDGETFICNLAVINFIKRTIYSFDFIPELIGISPELKEIQVKLPPEYGTKFLKFSFDIESIKPDSSSNSYYGTKIPEDVSLYQGYRNLRLYQYDPVCSPDGKWIACTDKTFSPGIWIMPAEGGDPVRVYESCQHYKDYYIYSGTVTVMGFTPDSNEIVFSDTVIDEERGTIVTINESFTDEGERLLSINTAGNLTDIFAVNIYTGETRLVVQNAVKGFYSHDGGYFAYNNVNGRIKLLDTITGEIRELTDTAYDVFGFGPDDSYVIGYSRGVIKKIALEGETTEIVKSGYQFALSISPDGEWLLFMTNDNSLGVHNLETGNNYTLIPPDKNYTCMPGTFSYNGSKIVYTLKYKTDTNKFHLFSVDFDAAKYQKEIGVEKERPVEFTVVGSFPNPFNMATSIEISVNMAERYDLSVYNMAGQRIRGLLADATLTPGIHRVLWDGLDDSGRAVSSGVYFARLKGENAIASGRMMLIK